MTKQYGTPGPRVMKPEVATDPALARCSLGAQLLFDRLIVGSDDQGRQIGDPIVVKASCVPRVGDATIAKVRRWLHELETAGLLIQYEAAGDQLVQLTGWWRHQDAQRRIFPSRWPAPDGWNDRVKVEPGREQRFAGGRPPDDAEDDASWSAVDAAERAEPASDGRPSRGDSPTARGDSRRNGGTWPPEVSPSPMPHAGAYAGASSPGSTEALGAVGRANGRVEPVEGPVS